MDRHEEAPSLWPVGFAVGVVCLLVGLIISWPVAAVGAALGIVFGFLWARDVVKAGRGEVSPEPVPQEVDGGPSAPPIPAHDGEAAIPEPEPAERFPRSVFLELSTLGLGGIIRGIRPRPAI